MTHTPSLLLRGLPLLAALLLAAPAAADAQANRREAMLLSDRPQPRRDCRIDRDRLPALDVLVDSAALAGALARVADENGVPAEAYALYSVGRGPDGGAQRVEMLQTYLPQGLEPSLRELVRAHVRTDPRGRKNFRVRVAPGDAEAPIRVGHSEICQPGGLRTVQIEIPLRANVRRPNPIRVKTVVGANGQPLSAHPMQSSGIPGADEVVIQHILNARFTPGLIDEIPVEMEFIQTVVFRDRI